MESTTWPGGPPVSCLSGPSRAERVETVTTTTKLSLLGEQQPIAMRGRRLGERSRCSFLVSSRWAGSSRPLLHPVFGSLLFTGYCYLAGGEREESGQTEGRGERKTPLRLLSVEHLLLPVSVISVILRFSTLSAFLQFCFYLARLFSFTRPWTMETLKQHCVFLCLFLPRMCSPPSQKTYFYYF